MNGTRTIGEMPVSSAATAIVVANSIDIGPCSMLMNSQSKPEVFIILAMSVRPRRATSRPFRAAPAPHCEPASHPPDLIFSLECR
jgi:hypothetical protein